MNRKAYRNWNKARKQNGNLGSIVQIGKPKVRHRKKTMTDKETAVTFYPDRHRTDLITE